ncbi:MAG TPA: hypothetical protein PKE29_09905 [Phycisphaerales bacterium]|nr:hypothetical protein [Phycisphaerales bacterium]
MIGATNTLAQQGTFSTFVGFYCCAIPLGFGLALAIVYFGVRYFANRRR